MHRLLACYICYTLRHSHVNSLWSWDHQAKCRSQAEPKHVGNGKQNKMISSNKNQYSADQRVIWLHLRMADLWVVQSIENGYSEVLRSSDVSPSLSSCNFDRRFTANRCVIRISISRQNGSSLFPLYRHVTYCSKMFLFVCKTQKLILCYWKIPFLGWLGEGGETCANH